MSDGQPITATVERDESKMSRLLPSFTLSIEQFHDLMARYDTFVLTATKFGETHTESFQPKPSITDSPKQVMALFSKEIKAAIERIVWWFPPMMRPPRPGKDNGFGGGVYGEGRWNV